MVVFMVMVQYIPSTSNVSHIHKRILGEGYSLDDEEDMAIKQVIKLRVYQAPVFKCYMLDLFSM